MTAKPAARRAGAGTPSTFRELSPDESRALLARNHVGRLAVAFKSRVDIQPIHYAWAGDRLFGRTSEGGKLRTLRHSPWVAFEVEEVVDTFDWRSVVVHGTFYQLVEDGSPAERHRWRQAMELLREVVPLTGTRADPVPFRDVLFEIIIDTMTGREATTHEA